MSQYLARCKVLSGVSWTSNSLTAFVICCFVLSLRYRLLSEGPVFFLVAILGNAKHRVDFLKLTFRLVSSVKCDTFSTLSHQYLLADMTNNGFSKIKQFYEEFYTFFLKDPLSCEEILYTKMIKLCNGIEGLLNERSWAICLLHIVLLCVAFKSSFEK